jgi:hypothetical protein
LPPWLTLSPAKMGRVRWVRSAGAHGRSAAHHNSPVDRFGTGTKRETARQSPMPSSA